MTDSADANPAAMSGSDQPDDPSSSRSTPIPRELSQWISQWSTWNIEVSLVSREHEHTYTMTTVLPVEKREVPFLWIEDLLMTRVHKMLHAIRADYEKNEEVLNGRARPEDDTRRDPDGDEP